MKQLCKKLFLICSLLLSFSIFSVEYKKPLCSKTKYYSVHAITGSIAQIMCYQMLFYNCKAMHYLGMNKAIGSDLFYFFGIIPGAYLVYKTPQWTDTYILRLQRKRSTKNKFKNFVLRLLPLPWGPLLGEWASDGAVLINKDSINISERDS